MASPLSATASSGAASIPPPPKEFRCTWGGCTKSFSRAEHLHRHALNHNDGDGMVCARCNAVFKRKDLFDRHLARHKEKDIEAGGEGLGKLLTRKRLWRDSTGAIVSRRRPEHEKKKRNPSIPETPYSLSSRIKPIDQGNFISSQDNAPLSPKSLDAAANESVADMLGSDAMGRSGNIPAFGDEQWPIPNSDENLAFQDLNTDSYDFLCNASWGSQPLQTDVNPDLPYDDIFAPDTASSFNNPFTTMNYYSWLFGNGPWPTAGPDAPTTSTYSSGYSPNMSTPSFGQNISPLSSIDYPGTRLPPIDKSFLSPKFGSGSQVPNPVNGVPAFSEFLAMSQEPESMRSKILLDSIASETSTPPRGSGPNERYIMTPTDSRSSQDFPRSLNVSRKSSHLPIIDEVAHERMLRFIDRSHPLTPDGSEVTRDHPLLTISSLQHFSDLYFTHFNVSYPLLHQATFRTADVDSLLLMAILQLGATYSNKDDHLFAISLHNVMRTQIFGHPAFNTIPTLWMLQTILLVECFGKSRAGQLQHDMSHLFHGLLINLIRRSDCQSARCKVPDGNTDLSVRWRAEIDAEQRRRLALLCFMWDTQHAVLFSQSLCMNAAELKLCLPWDSTLWEAETAEEWHSASLTHQSPPSYLSILKSYINPDTEPRPQNLNEFSRVLMLHGLMSVAWDLNRRDQTSLGLAISPSNQSWQSRISRSYDAWSSDFTAYTTSTLTSLSSDPTAKSLFQQFITANLAIYHAAHIILHVEIIDLQIYAGASHIIGRPVSKTDRERSRQRIERWANAKDGQMSAAKAMSHAAQILRDGIRKLDNWDAGDMFHYPWCLYLATLTCWTFQTATIKTIDTGTDARIDGGGAESANDEDADWDSKAEMNALVSAMARAKVEDMWRVVGRYRTGDLPRVMVKVLGAVRWAVVQEGMVVLRGLVGRSELR